jgi:hypothetical protein
MSPSWLREALDRRGCDDFAIEVRLAEAMCEWFPANTQQIEDVAVAPSAV